MYQIKNCLLLTSFLFSFFIIKAQEACIASTGIWSDTEEEHPFLCNDINNAGTLVIPEGVTVTIDKQVKISGITTLIIRGILFFDGNTSRLEFPAGSGIRIDAGGELRTNVNNNSQRIRIGNKAHWTSKQGDIQGPMIYGDVTLPVELLSFRLSKEDDDVVLKWATSSEINSDFFAVEHSKDGLSFTTVGVLMAGGTTTDYQQYSYNHRIVPTGINYYRLRQVDMDGSEFWSEVKVINVEIKDYFSIGYSADFNEIRLGFIENVQQGGTIRIFDFGGRLLDKYEWTVLPQEITLDISHYKIGSYVLQVENTSFVRAKPFFKMAS